MAGFAAFAAGARDGADFFAVEALFGAFFEADFVAVARAFADFFAALAFVAPCSAVAPSATEVLRAEVARATVSVPLVASFGDGFGFGFGGSGRF